MADQSESITFDFAAHERTAISDYLKVQSFYQDFSSVVGRVTEECIKKRQIKVHSVQYRAKDPASYGRKAAIPSETDPS